MRKRCGFIASLVLNFDFTLLAILLSIYDDEHSISCHRCHVPPFRKRCMCNRSRSLDIAADESVILAYWQMHDKVLDSGFWKGLPIRVFRMLFRHAYVRARANQPSFDASVQKQLDRLHNMESQGCKSIDRPADTFAQILCSAVPASGNSSVDRAMEQLLYHLGRWIYLIDARDDLESDQKTGSYNPVAARYLPNERDECLSVTLEHSVNLMNSAAALLEFGKHELLVDNILQLGLPLVQHAVMSGEWSKMKKQKIWRNKHDRSI